MRATTTATMTPCPAWCRLRPGHDWDSAHDEGRLCRGHGGLSSAGSLRPAPTSTRTVPGVPVYNVQFHADSQEHHQPGRAAQGRRGPPHGGEMAGGPRLPLDKIDPPRALVLRGAV